MKSLVLFSKQNANLLVEANFFLLYRAHLLNLRLQKRTIVFFELPFNLPILSQASMLRSSASL